MNIKKNNSSKVTVIGAGQIGPDIAFHFAKQLSKSGTKIILIDISEAALDNAKNRINKKINKAIEAGILSLEIGQTINNSIFYTTDYQLASESEIIVEAATENESIKQKIFTTLESIVGEECIFLSNSSHMQPEVIFSKIKNKSRCLVAHYFFPAEINPVVELVPGSETNKNLTEELLEFYESIGKIPIVVKSSYGYAIDPIFEGLGQIAIYCLEKGLGDEKEIDAIAMKTLGLGVGPFTALNLTGGNPITAHGLDELGKLINPWFKTPGTLYKKVEKKENWNTAKKGEIIEVKKEAEHEISDLLLGAYLGITGIILDKNIVDISDLNMATELALVIKGPIFLMNNLGPDKTKQLVKKFAASQANFTIPESINNFNSENPWKLKDYTVKIKNNILIITIRRPKALNALNLTLLHQIKTELQNYVNNPDVIGVIITGFGTKAFVSGADISMLADLKTPDEGYQNSQSFQDVLNYIEDYPKPVVAALNGFAFGGGNELAMACHYRISLSGLKVQIAQPEVQLGFIPGAGGTQRLPRLIGIEKAAEILRTGKTLSSEEAADLGLIDLLVKDNIVVHAIQIIELISTNKMKSKKVDSSPLNHNLVPKTLDLKHLSKKIDEIIVKAIYEGTNMPLREGLKLESKLFSECMQTKDMKIGIENFKTKGPKVKADFIHQ